MENYKFNLKPKKVEKIKSKHRKIISQIPPKETVDKIKLMRKYEPESMHSELPVLWDRASGYQIFDASGNCWIDFCSGIFVANVGHSHPKILKAIENTLKKPLIHNYYFPSDIRAKLVKKIIEISPKKLNRVFLLTTGTEATECALKISRIWGKKINQEKIKIVSFEGAMHGKTLGALMVGGKTKEKHWIGKHDPNIHHLPFPFPELCPWAKTKDHKCNNECFNKSINELTKKIKPSNIASIFIESYHGWGALFYPQSYIKELEKWARKNNILIIFDEIQAGFGRTGKLFAFEHYKVKPDMICCGKGISSGLPLSAVIGKKELIDIDPSLNSTHGGNPVCCAAALANLEVIQKENLVNESKRKGIILEKELHKIQCDYPLHIRHVAGKGLVYALHIVNPATNERDVHLVDRIIERCMEKGLLMIRTGTGTIKIGPPLMIPDEALYEGISVLEEAIREIINFR